MKQKFLSAVLLIMIFLFLVLVQWPDGLVHLVFCDVGQGDAILITHGFRQILIDTGHNSDVLECLENNMSFWDRSLDLVVLTHADSDHIGGAKSVLNHYFVKKISSNSVGKNTDVFNSFKDAVQAEKLQGGEYLSLEKNEVINISDVLTLKNLSTRGSRISNDRIFDQIPETELSDIYDSQKVKLSELKTTHNDLSIVLLLTIGDVKILLTGDLEKKGEQALLEASLIEDVDILKVSHHGSKSSTSQVFLDVVHPEISVISVGANNAYHHPHGQTIQRLLDKNSQILRTDELGEIEIVTDGVKYWLNE